VKDGIGIPYDPDQAAAWLAEAGFPDGEGLPEITLMYNTSEAHKKIAETIAQMWQLALNVEVKIVNQEFGVLLETLQTDPPHIFKLAWGSDYPDADGWLNTVYNSASGMNFGHFADDEFDTLVEDASREPDPQTRKALYKRAEEILVGEVVGIAPIYHFTNVTLTKPHLDRTVAAYGGEQFPTWRAFVR
jgi:oligopeptide transport system substrate-binding protein